ncbi:hypothetical protein ES703_92424 [subsurface metagenome]
MHREKSHIFALGIFVAEQSSNMRVALDLNPKEY